MRMVKGLAETQGTRRECRETHPADTTKEHPFQLNQEKMHGWVNELSLQNSTLGGGVVNGHRWQHVRPVLLY